MKFERSELGALFSKLRTAVPEVRAVMAALLIYAACCVDGDIDRQSKAHPPKSEKGRDDGKV